MENKSRSHRKVIASVQNALNILDLFAGKTSELGNAEIARRLGMNTGTVAGLVYTLKANKYLDQNPENRKYRLGLKIAERASELLNQMDLRKIAAPYLEELRDWCGESVNLGILDGQEVVYIERLFGHHALGIRSEIGKRAPLHSTSLGKAIAAHLSRGEQGKLLENYHFFQVTPFTIIEREQFVLELEKIRSLGYAVDEQENELGGICLGAPIFNHNGAPVAAISISSPVQRFEAGHRSEYSQRLIATAKAISRVLGCTSTGDEHKQ